MKKVIQFGTIPTIEKSNTKNGLVIAGRAGKKAWVQNFEAQGVKIEFDDKNHELLLRIPLAEGQFVVIADADGVAEQKTIEAKP